MKLAPYSDLWPKLFENEARQLREMLGDNGIAVHHVGSTAVPDLIAKPKIDMLAVVKTPLTSHALEALGYTYQGEYNIPLHGGFRKRARHDFNLHVYEEGHPEIALNLIFRDTLRRDTATRESYAALKQQLAEEESAWTKTTGPFMNYTLRKGTFIRQVLQDMGFVRSRVIRCTDESEWQAVQTLQESVHVPPALRLTTQPALDNTKEALLMVYRGGLAVGFAHVLFAPINNDPWTNVPAGMVWPANNGLHLKTVVLKPESTPAPTWQSLHVWHDCIRWLDKWRPRRES